MREAFVILEPALADAERVWREALRPALAECGLGAARPEAEDEGRFADPRTLKRLREAPILVVDLTGAGPARHLEVGYALGLGREAALILCAREDHNRDAPWFDPQDGKFAFSARGRDVLWWSPERLEEFRRELEGEIRRRLALADPAESGGGADPLWDPLWVRERREDALGTLSRMRMHGYLEVRFALPSFRGSWDPAALRDAAVRAEAAVSRSGLVLGPAYLRPHEPEAEEEGIACEVQRDGQLVSWALRTGGDYYLFKGSFEDFHHPGTLKADVRILRVAQALLHAARLYEALGLPPEAPVRIAMRSSGIEHRVLDALFYDFPPVSEDGAPFGAACSVPRSATETITVSLRDLEPNLPALTRRLTRELFLLFGGYEPPRSAYEALVGALLAALREGAARAA